METLYDIKQKSEELISRFNSIAKKKDVEKLKTETAELEIQTSANNFWSDQEKAQKVMQRLGDIKNEIERVKKLEESTAGLSELITEEIETDPDLKSLVVDELNNLETQINSIELTTFLSGKFDESDALLTIKAGQGGTEAMDWTEILLRMYLRYVNSVGWKVSIVDEVRGQEAGYQTVQLKIEGRFAYGYLKHEKGTHRMVRNSPFNSQGLRQTSFAGVEVIPVVNEEIDIEIRDEDIDFSAVRSGGAGGQNVNKVATKVRIVHKPSGITVTCSIHRTQPKNRDEAMKILKAQLYLLEEEKRDAEMKAVKGVRVAASWGNQIRNYVFQPYKLVKDLRTDVETSNIDSVMDGNLQEFIDAEIRLL